MTESETGRSTPRRGIWAWALFDWANSPFTTVIITFVFATYFAKAIVGSDAEGQSLWGYTASISGLFIAVLSPILGAIADVGGRRKPWIAVFTAICVVGSAALWWATPERASISYAMFWVVIATVGFEFGVVFNNAMLPDLVHDSKVGRWSGWAWSIGYAGGLVALIIALAVRSQAEALGLDTSTNEDLRLVGPLVALWLAVFSLPMFLFTPDKPSTRLSTRAAVIGGLRLYWKTLRHLRHYGNLSRFLVARMIYADGMATIFAIGGTYAQGAFDMSFDQVIIFGIVLNVSAGLGALAFSWVDDWLGSRTTILVSVAGLIASALAAALVENVTLFWIAGAVLGIFVGPAQSASRTMMARIAPREMFTEFFGLYALTGKATAFLGPLIVGIVTAASGEQRLGMMTVVAFFIVGGALMLGVTETRAEAYRE